MCCGIIIFLLSLPHPDHRAILRIHIESAQQPKPAPEMEGEEEGSLADLEEEEEQWGCCCCCWQRKKSGSFYHSCCCCCCPPPVLLLLLWRRLSAAAAIGNVSPSCGEVRIGLDGGKRERENYPALNKRISARHNRWWRREVKSLSLSCNDQYKSLCVLKREADWLPHG